MEWISVNDRLPETNKRVLTYADNGAMFAAHLDGYWYVAHNKALDVMRMCQIEVK